MIKKAQVSIFIIIAILIVVFITIFFLVRFNFMPDIDLGGEINPRNYLKNCIEDKVLEAVKILSNQGGNLDPELYIHFKFENEPDYYNISYLCYNTNYYFPCIAQVPLLIQHINSEITSYIEDDVEQCFIELKENLEAEGFEVDMTYKSFWLELGPEQIVINTDSEVSYEKAGISTTLEDFQAKVQSRFYEVFIIIQEIVMQEAKYCNFDQLGFMLLYPEFNIDKFRTGHSTVIYRLNHEKDKIKARFAVRSCVIPPAY